MLASAPLLPKFVSEGAAMYHELRKRGTSIEAPADGRNRDRSQLLPCAAGGRPSREAMRMPAPTAIRPTIRLSPIGSLSTIAATIEAASGFTVIVFATRVGVVRLSAKFHR